MDQVGEVSSIIQDHVEGLTIFEVQGLFNAPHILLICLTLPGIYYRWTEIYLVTCFISKIQVGILKSPGSFVMYLKQHMVLWKALKSMYFLLTVTSKI